MNDISVIANLPDLAHLDLSGTQVSDITALEYLWAPICLDLSGTQVTDWAPVNHIENVGGRP